MKFQRVIKYRTVGSTQSIAKKIDRKSPAVVSADVQTGGRGRAGRSWFSPQGGLWVSFMIPHEKEARLSHYVTLVGALGVIEFLEEVEIRGVVRWPNDILVNEKKIAGILGEYHRGAIICGIGINVNIRDFPKWIGPATSLAIIKKKNFQIDQLRDRFIQIYDNCFSKFEQNGGGAIVQMIRPHFSSSSDLVSISYGTREIKGIFQDIDEEGALVLRTESGSLMKVFSGEMRRVKWS